MYQWQRSCFILSSFLLACISAFLPNNPVQKPVGRAQQGWTGVRWGRFLPKGVGAGDKQERCSGPAWDEVSEFKQDKKGLYMLQGGWAWILWFQTGIGANSDIFLFVYVYIYI